MSFNTPIQQRIASENDVRDRSGRAVNSSVGAATAAPSKSMISSSKQMYTTEFVKALFGDAGIVVGDFSCSYQRQAGRLYVSADAVFFYSHLFGFEKRVKIDYTQAIEIDFVRSTSIFFRTNDTQFIFRSFEDRKAVLELIQECHSKCSTSSTAVSSEDVPPATRSVDSKSDDLESLISDQDEDETEQTVITCQDSPPDTTKHVPKPDTMPRSSLDGAFLWEKMKSHSKDWQSIIAAEKLRCNSVSDFFVKFLRDSCPDSMSYFQSKVMGDNNVVLEAWTKNAAPDGEQSNADSLSRMIEFEHTTRWAVAKVKRRQTYQACGKNAVIQNFTHLRGIPQADAFFVEDMWLLEASTDGPSVFLSVRFRIVWEKNTMLKSVITNRTKTEAQDWFNKYIPFVCEKLGQTPTAVKREESETNLSSMAKFAQDVFGLCHSSTVLIMVIALSLYTHRLRQRIINLEDLVDEIQLKMIQQIDRLSVEEINFN